jgi:hypothetical protein
VVGIELLKSIMMRRMILPCRKTITINRGILKDLNHKKKLMLEKQKKLRTVDGPMGK